MRNTKGPLIFLPFHFLQGEFDLIPSRPASLADGGPFPPFFFAYSAHFHRNLLTARLPRSIRSCRSAARMRRPMRSRSWPRAGFIRALRTPDVISIDSTVQKPSWGSSISPASITRSDSGRRQAEQFPTSAPWIVVARANSRDMVAVTVLIVTLPFFLETDCLPRAIVFLTQITCHNRICGRSCWIGGLDLEHLAPSTDAACTPGGVKRPFVCCQCAAVPCLLGTGRSATRARRQHTERG